MCHDPPVTDSLFGRSRAEVEAALPDREPVNCPLCGREPRLFGVDFQGFHLARCPGCRLEFQHPRPLLGQLAAAVYKAHYHPPVDARTAQYRDRSFAHQLARLARHVTPPATLLDVGCGDGAFLRCAQAAGWDVAGSDIHLTDGARRTGVRLFEGPLPDIRFDGDRFDAIRFNQVLEHTPDPLAQLRAARRVVSDGGILLIGVPNIAAWGTRLKNWQSRLGLKRRRWKHYGALHHLWFFTPATLRRLVEAAGFRVVQWETPPHGRPEPPGPVRTVLDRSIGALRAGGILDLYAEPADAPAVSRQ